MTSVCSRRSRQRSGSEGHEGQVGLVAEHGGGDDLHAVGLGRLHGRGDRLGLGQRPRLAEQVEDTPPHGGLERFRHGA